MILRVVFLAGKTLGMSALPPDLVRKKEGIQNDNPYKNLKNHGIRCCFHFRHNRRI